MKYTSLRFGLIVLLGLVLSPGAAIAVDISEFTAGEITVMELSGPDVPELQQLSVKDNGDIVCVGTVDSGFPNNREAVMLVVSDGSATMTVLPDGDNIFNAVRDDVVISPDGNFMGAKNHVWDISDTASPVSKVVLDFTGAGADDFVEVYGVANNGNAAVTVGSIVAGRFTYATGFAEYLPFPADVDADAVYGIDAAGDTFAGWRGLAADPDDEMPVVWDPDSTFLPKGSFPEVTIRFLSPDGNQAVGIEGVGCPGCGVAGIVTRYSASGSISPEWTTATRTELFNGFPEGITDEGIVVGNRDDGVPVIVSPGFTTPGNLMTIEEWYENETSTALPFAATRVYHITKHGDDVYIGVNGSTHIIKAPLSAFSEDIMGVPEYCFEERFIHRLEKRLRRYERVLGRVSAWGAPWLVNRLEQKIAEITELLSACE